MVLKFQKIHQDAQIPKLAHPTDAGLDVCSVENKTIKAGSFATISTGLVMQIPKGHEVQVRSRSGLAAKNGIFVLNGIGTIDAGYRGELKVILANFSSTDFEVSKGDRIAQLVANKLTPVKIKTVEHINNKTDRSTGGFGSSGK